MVQTFLAFNFHCFKRQILLDCIYIICVYIASYIQTYAHTYNSQMLLLFPATYNGFRSYVWKPIDLASKSASCRVNRDILSEELIIT